jgi:2-polyprenyl-3-methyl-5-hydroxy-6-metoxy-1,4-benzoquinol methylase
MRIETKYPNAVGPDFDSPMQGAAQNNHSNQVYLNELHRVANKPKFSYMDFGCAGGQSVVDLYMIGYEVAGIEGSDLDKMISISKNRTKPEPRFIGDTSVITEDIHDNWINFKDKCLFKSDITKPFQMFNDDGTEQKFDIITAWDVLEHPKPESIPDVLSNIKNHLSEDGVFICLINLVHGTHHQCVKPNDWWVKIFDENGFENIGFDFNASPRHTKYPLDTNDLGFMVKLKK